MKARLTICPQNQAADDVVLDISKRYAIGRSAENEITITEPSISRMHAELEYRDGTWVLTDLASQNGIWVNGIQQQQCILVEGFNVTIGNVPVLFESLSEQQLDAEKANNEWRLSSSKSMLKQLDLANNKSNFLFEQISTVVSLTNMDRGLLLLGDSLRTMRLRVTCGVNHVDFSKGEFTGSAGAIEQAVITKTPMISMDTSAHPMLSQRDTIKSKGIAALVAMPLCYEETLIGVIYADSKQAGKMLKQIDLDILSVLAEQISASIHSLIIDQHLTTLLEQLQSQQDKTIVNISLEEINTAS